MPAHTLAQPREPTEAEKVLHEATHQPYQSWCQACVMSRALDDRHVSEPVGVLDESKATVIQVDFCYITKEDTDPEVAAAEGSSGQPVVEGPEQSKYTMLVAADRDSRAVLVVPAEQKGKSSTKRLVQGLFEFSLQVGLQDVILQGDNEPSIRSLLNGVKVLRTKRNVRTDIRYPQEGQPKSNGRAERAVRTIKEMGKCLREMVFAKSGFRIKTEHPLHAWSHVHGCSLRNNFAVNQRTKMTPRQMLGLGKYSGALATFGEKVIGLKPNPGKSLQRWRAGVWIGKDPRTDGHLIAGLWGVFVVRTIRRLPQKDCWKPGDLDAVRGLPWNFTSGAVVVRDSNASRLVYPALAAVEDGEAGDEAGSEPSEDEVAEKQPVLPDSALLSSFIPQPQGVSVGPQFLLQSQHGGGSSNKSAPPSSAAVSGPVIHPVPMESVLMERKRLDEQGGTDGPSPKAPKVNAVQVGGEELPDQDDTLEGEFSFEESDDEDWYDEYAWWMQKLVMSRLFDMKVFAPIAEEEAMVMEHLTCRYVYDWRKRPDDRPSAGKWFRRARMVSREYKYLDPGRAGLFAATVPPAVSKLLCVCGH